MTKGKAVVHINLDEIKIKDIQDVSVVITTKDNTKILYNKWYMTEQEEPKTGHWIMIDKELQRYKCSECGEIIRLYENETLDSYPYSHCGARMEE